MRFPRKLSKRVFWSIFAVILFVDLAKHIGLFSLGQAQLRIDAREYWEMGTILAKGNIVLRETDYVHRTPGYPAFLVPHQLFFGRFALVGVIVAQHILCMATAIIVGLTCGRVVRSDLAVLVGYLLIVLCIGRPAFANLVYTETVFTFLLALTLFVFVPYCNRPSSSRIFVVGLILGIVILVRPIAQLAWISFAVVILLLAIRNRPSFTYRKALSHVALFLLAISIIVAPWLIRNASIHGRVFLSKIAGRAIWESCFHEHGANLDRPPSFHELCEIANLDSSDPRTGRPWYVTYYLIRNAQMPSIEIDERMTDVALDAIRNQPQKFSADVLWRVCEFWFVSDIHHRVRQREDINAKFNQTAVRLPSIGQPFCRLINVLPRYEISCAIVSAACWLGAFYMLMQQKTRMIAVTLILLMGYFCCVTVIMEYPRFRYRAVLEPAMILCIVGGSFALWRWLKFRKRLLAIRALRS